MQVPRIPKHLQEMSLSAGDALADIKLVWANCRGYNPAGDPILASCEAAQKNLQERWLLAGLPSENLFDELPPSAVLKPAVTKKKRRKKDSKVAHTF